MTSGDSEKLIRGSFYHDSEIGINSELQYTQLLLTILGVWPMIIPCATRADKLLSLIAVSGTLIAVGLSVIPTTMFMFMNMKTWRKRLVFFGPMGFRLSNFLKYLFIIYRSDVIKNCMNRMRANWTETNVKEDHIVMLESANLGRCLTTISATFMYSAGIFFHVIMPLVKHKQTNSYNVTIRPLVLPGYEYFLNTQVSPTYEIVFGIQCLCAASLYTIVTAASNLAAVFVSHICGQVQIIKLKFQRLQQNEPFDNFHYVDSQIASIVQCHVNMLQFSANVRRALREICLIEVLHSTLVLCWLEFFCLTEWKNSEAVALVTWFLLFISLTSNIFIFCYIGEILKNQCEFVGEMTYMIDWYKIPKRNLLSLILIIAVSKNSCYITAGGMMKMTIRGFVHVMKTSLAYFQMLRTATAAF